MEAKGDMEGACKQLNSIKYTDPQNADIVDFVRDMLNLCDLWLEVEDQVQAEIIVNRVSSSIYSSKIPEKIAQECRL